MKIVAVSDTHLRHNFEVPNGDILIHAGDSLFDGTGLELIAFNKWFSKLPHRYKIMIAGNHERIIENSFHYARSLLSSDIIYLQDRMIEVQGLKIYGTPWNEMSETWAFSIKNRYERSKKWDLIPDDLDILITHIPPYGILDKAGGFNQGCPELRKTVFLRKPKYHIFGHIMNEQARLELKIFGLSMHQSVIGRSR